MHILEYALLLNFKHKFYAQILSAKSAHSTNSITVQILYTKNTTYRIKYTKTPFPLNFPYSTSNILNSKLYINIK